MNDSADIVRVSRDLEDLIPTFMGNRRKELDALRAALAAADFEQLRQIGHRMRGVGHSYGFDDVSDIGRRIEEGTRNGDKAALEAQLSRYADYLTRVQIVYE